MSSAICPRCLQRTDAATKTASGIRYYCVRCNRAIQPTDVIPRSYYEERRKS